MPSLKVNVMKCIPTYLHSRSTSAIISLKFEKLKRIEQVKLTMRSQT